MSNLSFDAALGRLSGSVSMEINNSVGQTDHAVNAQFLCRIFDAASMPQSEQLTALAREALRQARRLPDYVSLQENKAFLHNNIAVAA